MANSREAMFALDRIGVPSGGRWFDGIDGGEAVYDRIVNNIDGLSYTPKEQKPATDNHVSLEELWRERDRLELELESVFGALRLSGVQIRAATSASQAASFVADKCRSLRDDLGDATDHIEALQRQLDEANKRDETAKQELEKLRDKQGRLGSQIAALNGRLLDKSLRIAELKDELNAANKRDERSDLEPSDCGCESSLDAPAYPERLRLAFRVIENHFDCHQITNGEALALSVLSSELSP